MKRVALRAQTYQQWMTTQPPTITPAESASRYEAYAAEFDERTARTFFADHQFEEWLRSAYATREHLQQRSETQLAARVSFIFISSYD